MGFTVSMNRVEIFDDLTAQEVNQISNLQNLKYIQMSKDVSLETLELINDIVLSRRNDVQFRVYRYYNLECDLCFLGKLTNVVDLSIGEMDTVENIEILETLPHLRKLRINLNKLSDIRFLSNINREITDLMIGTGINNSKLSIDILERFKRLKSLFLYKINYGYNSLISVKSLRNLTINASKIKDLSFLYGTNIDSLSFGLSNIEDCSSLYGNNTIRELELWKLNKLPNLNILCELPSLEYAKIRQISQIESVPDLKDCINLKKIIFDDLKNLEDILSLSDLPNLECLEFYGAKSINVNDIETILKKVNTLNSIKCHTGNVKNDMKISKILNRFGYL